MHISSILTKAVATWPDKNAVICGVHKFTYHEFSNRVNKIAGFLSNLGLAPGARAAIMHPNCHIFLEAYYAAALANLVLTPINTRLSPNELSYIFQDSGAGVLITHVDFKNTIDEAINRTDKRYDLRSIIWTNNERSSQESFQNIKSFDYERIIGEGAKGSDAIDKINEHIEIAQLYYTSGTTGKPKGVMLTHSNVILHSEGTIKEFNLTGSDVWGHIAPMYHLADAWATFAVTMIGGTHVLVPRFEPKLVLKNIQNNGVTISNLIPTMLNMLVNYPTVEDFDFSSLRCLLSGGAPIAPELVKKVIKTFKCDYIQTYGMTETSPYLTVSILKEHLKELPEEERLKYISRTGRPFITVDLKVVDESGAEVSANDTDVGEVWVKGPTITPGYWHDPEETAAAFEDGWLKTGDLAVMDHEGYINIVDRKKDMIITGGENVYSTEVEHVLYEHSGILEAAVIGVPDEKWGEIVVAVVVPRDSIIVDPDEVIEFCKSRMTHFKAPKAVDIIDKLPKTGSGKVAKGILKAKYWNK